MDVKTIHELVRQAEQQDRFGTTTSSKYVQFSMREDIDRTEAYLNSKHISGETDYMGREKPFFNIVLAARNIWFRATDIDRKNIIIRASKESDAVEALLATIKFQEWMKRQGFGRFLNDWGLSLATHGSSIVKFIEKGGELHCQVMDWNNMIVDPIDFDNNLKIEKLWYTPAQLRQQKNYDQKYVKQLLDNLTTRKTLDGQTQDLRSGYIPVYEVHGEMSLAQYKMGKGEDIEDGDEDEFFQQMHVITFLERREDAENYDDFHLYCGRESRDPYMLTHLIKRDGQTYAGGAVKNLFEAQWMVNHSQKQMKDQLDLASKLFFQTADGSLAGQNALTNIENGDIIVFDQQKGPLTAVNNKPDIGAMQAYKADWQAIAAQINGISEAMMGANPPSGSAWRQTQALLQESHSLFETMTENKGLSIIDMMTNYILPFFKKQLADSDEIASVLEDHQIKEIDNRYLPNEAIRLVNKKKIDTILGGNIYDPGMEGMDTAEAETMLKSTLNGNQRFIKPSEIKSKTWKEIFKDLEWDVDIDVTGEAKDTQGALATLTTVLQTLASNPGVVQDPNIRLVFNKILNLAGGISPLEITTAQAAPSQAPDQLMQSLAAQGQPQMQPQL